MRAFIQSPAARRLAFLLAVSGLIWVLAGPVAAQTTVARQTQGGQTVERTLDLTASDTREQLQAVLKRYPSAIGRILRLDPSLMSREDYLTPYPDLAVFLKSHPEILRNPEYYFYNYGSNSFEVYDPQARAWNYMLDIIAFGGVMITIVLALAWVIKTAIDYRRWGRLAKVQAEAHTKLLDRFTGNEELLAYVKSPAGSRFLESAPIALDGAPKAMAAPLSRILWSINAGVVLTAAGIGMNYASRWLSAQYVNRGFSAHNDADPFFVVSAIVLSIGIGFVAAAALSFVISKRLGLFGQARIESVQ